MRIEHFAFNVKDPIAVAEWYCQNLGFTVKHKFNKAPHTHFLADSTDNVMIEIYNNPPGEVPDYPSMNPLTLHLAFVSADPEADAERLCAAGCKVVDDVRLNDGSVLLMLKDPWGFAIQLCKRGNPMV
ncbi:VOC family protein [Gilvimarinus agarilyticus]|uniref:VOC family protein n=1 Tax=Gilvimarinus agarilyticus TaxID=679259 RepID=UPI0005A134B0|nr:VOC family protein [Gilvimarinus agarilyticus]